MLRIAIYGSECTGKTTLARLLAGHYDTFWVPEYSRIYCETKPLLDISDVLPIMRGQIATEAATLQKAETAGKKLIFCDTIPLSSITYSEYYNHDVPEGAEELATDIYNLYLLPDIGTPWEHDGVRGENVNRPLMHLLFVQSLEKRNRAYTLLQGSYMERFEQAKYAVNALLSATAQKN